MQSIHVYIYIHVSAELHQGRVPFTEKCIQHPVTKLLVAASMRIYEVSFISCSKILGPRPTLEIWSNCEREASAFRVTTITDCGYEVRVYSRLRSRRGGRSFTSDRGLLMQPRLWTVAPATGNMKRQTIERMFVSEPWRNRCITTNSRSRRTLANYRGWQRASTRL